MTGVGQCRTSTYRALVIAKSWPQLDLFLRWIVINYQITEALRTLFHEFLSTPRENRVLWVSRAN
jgi:hypothetical protein